MTQTGYEDISLENLIVKSNVIVIAERLDPPFTEEEIIIHPDKEKYPPYKKTTYHFKVTEDLFPKERYSGQVISVNGYEFEKGLQMHKNYYLHDMGVSPVLELYEGKASRESKQLIIFLKIAKAGLEFSALSSYESVSERSKIKKLIRKIKK